MSRNKRLVGDADSALRLYDSALEALRTRYCARPAEHAQIHRIRRFIRFHGSSQPRSLTAGDVNCFPSNLAFQEVAAATTHNRDQAAVLFLNEYVLEQSLIRALRASVTVQASRMAPVRRRTTPGLVRHSDIFAWVAGGWRHN